MRKLLTLLTVSLSMLLIASGVRAASYTMIDNGSDGVRLQVRILNATSSLQNLQIGFLDQANVFYGAAAKSGYTPVSVIPAAGDVISFALREGSNITPLGAGTLHDDKWLLTFSLPPSSPYGPATVNIRVQNGDSMAPVEVHTPEPASLFLLAGTMVVGLGFLRRRQKKCSV